ncbi:MAG: hypothetical protein ACK55Z_33775 [bacterium]
MGPFFTVLPPAESMSTAKGATPHTGELPRVGFMRATDVSNNMGGGGGRETNERLLYLFWPIASATSIVL